MLPDRRHICGTKGRGGLLSHCYPSPATLLHVTFTVPLAPRCFLMLDKILYPADLRALKESDLKQVADELRREMIDAVSVTGGHLGAGLGVVELTVALHYVFDTPRDKLIWDVGHQAYPHKILTGRRDRIRTLRQ